jgi:CRP-like cAMP-binding protein
MRPVADLGRPRFPLLAASPAGGQLPVSWPRELAHHVTVVTPSPGADFMTEQEEILDALRGVSFLADVPDDTLERLAARCIVRHVGAGHVLFTAGEECLGLWVVREGRVRIFRTGPEGREQVLQIEGAGRPVAELPLFDGGAYPASADTLEPSRLVFMPRGEFELFYRTNPDAAQAIIRALGKRLRHLVHMARTLAFRDVAARLALWLAGQAEQAAPRAAPDGSVELELDRTQEELALELGTARESVSRAFRQLREKGLLDPLEGKRVRIPDVERLRAYSRVEG